MSTWDPENILVGLFLIFSHWLINPPRTCNLTGTSTTSSQSSNWSTGCPTSIKLNSKPIISEPTDAVVISSGKFKNDKFLLSEPDKFGRNSRENVEENRTRILYAFDQTAFHTKKDQNLMNVKVITCECTPFNQYLCKTLWIPHHKVWLPKQHSVMFNAFRTLFSMNHWQKLHSSEQSISKDIEMVSWL